MQAIMHGSSVLALRSELARFARLRVSGLPDDAEEEQLVEAARSELASGWLLLVDDVGPDLDGVLVSCLLCCARLWARCNLARTLGR